MNWSLADAMAPQQTIPGGAAAYDIAGLVLAGRALEPITRRIHDYVRTMRLARKPIECVRLSVDDYNKLIRGVAKAKSVKVDEVFGLRHDGIPVVSTK